MGKGRSNRSNRSHPAAAAAVPRIAQPPTTHGGHSGGSTRDEPTLAPWIDAPEQAQAEAAYERIFGRKMTMAELGALSGARAGDVVYAVAMNQRRLRVYAEGPRFERAFEVWRARGKVIVEDQNTESSHAHRGHVGQDIVQGMQTIARLGVDELRAEAARSGSMNGYYTWARMGFVGNIPRSVLPAARAAFGRHVDRVEELMRLPGGRQWWKEHGDTWGATFDFTPGSYSMRTLATWQGILASRSGRTGGGGGS